jgi:hypothetical protein
MVRRKQVVDVEKLYIINDNRLYSSSPHQNTDEVVDINAPTSVTDEAHWLISPIRSKC